MSKTKPTKQRSIKKKSHQVSKANAVNRRSAVILAVIFLFGAVGVYLLSSSNAATRVNISAATYNILGQHHDPTTRLDPWSKRKARVSSRISSYDPGIIGLQEVTRINPLNGTSSTQRADVVKFMAAKGYAGYVGSSKNNSPVFWKKGTFTVLAKKEALIQPQNSNADGPAARYLTYVRLKKGTKKISVFNYHYNQYRNDTVQLERLKKHFNAFKVSGDHVIFTGDFNRRDLQVRNYTGTWRVDSHTGIDHVMAAGKMSLLSERVVPKGSPAASDHPLVGVKVTLN